MASSGGAYLFLLGLATGITLLTLTAFRRISPAWLKALLIACGALTISRYATMALFSSAERAARFWFLRPCWYATSIGLGLPSVMAIDQLLRHPALSPKKLLVWMSPFLVIDALVMAFGSSEIPAQAGRVSLRGGWQPLFAATQAVFLIAFLGICLSLIQKIASRPIRLALAGLAAAHAYLGIDGVLLVLGRWYFHPFLFSEMLTLVAIWYAYETSQNLQA